eukprot:1183662-Prorocentrum_minimum.AAC.2
MPGRAKRTSRTCRGGRRERVEHAGAGEENESNMPGRAKRRAGGGTHRQREVRASADTWASPANTAPVTHPSYV